MGATATLETDRVGSEGLVVRPGEEVTVILRVRNNGPVVDEMTFEPLGAAAAWIDVEPASISLFPGAEGRTTIRFVPPRSPDVAPGEVPYAVRVRSREDPDGSVAEEGVITVERFEDRSVEMYPPSTRGRRRGRYEVAVDNRGNAPIQIGLAANDAAGACRFRFDSELIPVGPGSAAYTKLRAAPVKTFWKGPPKSHQFQVVVTEDGHEPEVVNGTFLQEALLPPWILKAVLAALALVLVLFILWQTLFKSTVESAARDAVAKPLASLSARVDEVAPTSTTVAGGGAVQGATTTTAAGAGTGPGAGGTGTTVAGGGGTATTVGSGFSTAFGDPTDFQLVGIVTAGDTQSFSKTFNEAFALTDMVLQNPGGDTGSVQIMRGGAVLKVSALENFRDYDLHFVAPFVFKSGDSIVMKVSCGTPGPTNGGTCSISGSFAGFQK